MMVITSIELKTTEAGKICKVEFCGVVVHLVKVSSNYYFSCCR